MSVNDAGRLFVLTGPSGVGKDAVLDRLQEMGAPFRRALTATTRAIRPGECNGVDYIFISRPEFEHLIGEDGLLEWASVYGNLYGVLRSQVTEAMERGENVLLKIDIQGAATVRAMHPDAVLIFLAPPDMETLDRRLIGRGTESGEVLRVKVETAREEMKAASWFDHVVVNHEDRIEDTAREITRIAETVAAG